VTLSGFLLDWTSLVPHLWPASWLVSRCPFKDTRRGRGPPPTGKKLPVITLAEREEAVLLAGLSLQQSSEGLHS
jgi:hypothetical protein